MVNGNSNGSVTSTYFAAQGHHDDKRGGIFSPPPSNAPGTSSYAQSARRVDSSPPPPSALASSYDPRSGHVPSYAQSHAQRYEPPASSYGPGTSYAQNSGINPQPREPPTSSYVHSQGESVYSHHPAPTTMFSANQPEAPSPPLTEVPPTPPRSIVAPPQSTSSADSGFFQQSPTLGNQFTSDVALQRILAFYVPFDQHRKALESELKVLGDKVISPPVLRYLEDAERNLPQLESRNAFSAQRDDSLRTSEGWRKLVEMGTKEGCVAEGYSGRLGRLGQFARYYIFSPSSALTTCPFAMTDGAARLLTNHLSRPPPPPPTPSEMPKYSPVHAEAEASRRVFAAAKARLISRDPAKSWTSGQWMTERPGGSDVSRTETIATYAPSGAGSDVGPWSISGFKFFSSATDADMAILLARTPGSRKLSAFFAPMRLPSGARNGVRIVRLKKKLGTRSLPTAELELKDMRAWLLGTEGGGIREIATILTITRVHNAVSAISFMRRALAVAKAYSRVRLVARGKPLHKNPLHLHTLARLELLTRSATHLTFLAVYLLSLCESPSSTPAPALLHTPAAAAPALLRVLTPLAKAATAKLSLAVVSESVEALGGVGYLENEEPLNVARLLRDAQVLAIWEGTTNVLVVDLVATIAREEVRGVLGEWIKDNLGRWTPGPKGGDAEGILERCKVAVWTEWVALEGWISGTTREELTGAGRRVLWRLAWVVIGLLMVVDARRDRELSAVECTRRWVLEGFGGVGGDREEERRREKEVEMGVRWGMDRRIVFGAELEGRPRL